MKAAGREGLPADPAITRLSLGRHSVAYLPAQAHEGVVLVAPEPGPGKKPAPGHEEVVGIVAVDGIEPQEGVPEAGHEPLRLGAGDARRGLASGVCSRTAPLFRGQPSGRLGAFVEQEQDSLGEVEGARLARGGNGDDALAALDLGVFQAPVLGAEDKGRALPAGKGCRYLACSLLRAFQGPAPAARAGRGADDEVAVCRGVLEALHNGDAAEQGQALGRCQGRGLLGNPAFGRCQRQLGAAHVGAGPDGHAHVFRKARVHEHDAKAFKFHGCLLAGSGKGKGPCRKHQIELILAGACRRRRRRHPGNAEGKACGIRPDALGRHGQHQSPAGKLADGAEKASRHAADGRAAGFGAGSALGEFGKKAAEPRAGQSAKQGTEAEEEGRHEHRARDGAGKAGESSAPARAEAPCLQGQEPDFGGLAGRQHGNGQDPVPGRKPAVLRCKPPVEQDQPKHDPVARQAEDVEEQNESEEAEKGACRKGQAHGEQGHGILLEAGAVRRMGAGCRPDAGPADGAGP